MPWLEAVSEDAQWIAGGAKRITTVLVLAIRVVVKGVQQAGDARASFEPRLEQSARAPEWDLRSWAGV